MFSKFAFSINFEWIGEKLAKIVHSQNRLSLDEWSGGGTFLKLSEILIHTGHSSRRMVWPVVASGPQAENFWLIFLFIPNHLDGTPLAFSTLFL